MILCGSCRNLLRWTCDTLCIRMRKYSPTCVGVPRKRRLMGRDIGGGRRRRGSAFTPLVENRLVHEDCLKEICNSIEK